MELVYYVSIKSTSNIIIAQLIDLTEKTVGEWRTLIHTAVASWFINNPIPLGGPGVIVELDKAKFGKRKYNRGAYRDELDSQKT